MRIIAIVSRIIGDPQRAEGVQNTIINLCGWIDYIACFSAELPDPMLVCNTIKDLLVIFRR